MMVEFEWSPIARKDYWNNIDYLLEEWSDKEALRFIGLVEQTLNIIKRNPKAFIETNYKNIRAVVITPQITLFYKILDESKIELVRFWNNYQNPKNLNI